MIKLERCTSNENVPNPTYEEVCTKSTGHYEAVQIVYDEYIC